MKGVTELQKDRILSLEACNKKLESELVEKYEIIASLSEIQLKLNGYFYVTASLIKDINGKVTLKDLEETLNSLVAANGEHLAKIGATKEQIDAAIFRALTAFDNSTD